jgi:hypothetical protein
MHYTFKHSSTYWSIWCSDVVHQKVFLVFGMLNFLHLTVYDRISNVSISQPKM